MCITLVLMRITTKLRINAYVFVVIALIMCANEFQMRGGFEMLRGLLPVVTVP